MRPKAQQRIVGDIVEIDLGDRYYSYARVLHGAQFAFYAGMFKEKLSSDEIIKLPVLFFLAVMDKAVRKGRWRVVGNAPLDRSMEKPPPQFIQDAIRKDLFRIYEVDGRIRPATKDECVGLERAAVWDPTHVEERVRDHYAGRANKWVESLKLR